MGKKCLTLLASCSGPGIIEVAIASSKRNGIQCFIIFLYGFGSSIVQVKY